MAAPTTVDLVTDEYTEIAADIATVTALQVPLGGTVRLCPGASKPAATAAGIELRGGETALSADIADIGTTGALYGIAVYGACTVTVVTSA